jgi:transcriptional regulator with XRE-family HTH domain
VSPKNRTPSTGILRRLSYNVERLRRARGLSRAALGRASGLSKGHISNVENERMNASLATLEALTVGFDCDVVDLFQRIPAQALPVLGDEP